MKPSEDNKNININISFNKHNQQRKKVQEQILKGEHYIKEKFVARIYNDI